MLWKVNSQQVRVGIQRKNKWVDLIENTNLMKGVGIVRSVDILFNT
jgi:hypothetical protein